MDFSLSTTIDPPAVTLTAHGELDIFTARQVERELGAAMTAGCRDVRIDVGGVTFVDASALGVLARAQADLSAGNGGSLGFVAVSPPFRRLCALTGLDTVFELV